MATKRRSNIWTGAPYGRYKGAPGNPAEWRAAFEAEMTDEEAQVILGDRNPWVILSDLSGVTVKPGSTQDQIKRAYRRAALKHHPDLNPGDPKAEQRFKDAQSAYVSLKV